MDQPIAESRAVATATIALQSDDLQIIQACVGFHARAQTDPAIRARLYALWCKLDVRRAATETPGA